MKNEMYKTVMVHEVETDETEIIVENLHIDNI